MSGKYKVTIGLEIHAELSTKTKMFCNSKNDADEKKPNVNICPTCMGYPGTLPVINKAAVKSVLKVGVAVNGKLADFTEFDRKNYFYPDIPKGYQISQYKYPLVSGGELNGVQITRIHLEEDTARSTHENKDYSLVDFNRAGVPLMELVTEPVIHSAKEAGDFARELRTLLRTLGVSHANMEKGEMRVEANISISDSDEKGTKVEVKNLNSFMAAERAIAYEVLRQEKLLERGEQVVQETRGWHEGKQQTFSQRTKEDSHDYRYFPDPDLPKLKISEIPEFDEQKLKDELPELPWEKRERYKNEWGLKFPESDVFIRNEKLGKFLEDVEKSTHDKKLIKTASNFILTDLIPHMKKGGGEIPISSENFSRLMFLYGENKVSSRGAKDVLEHMWVEDDDPEKIAEREGLLQESDSGAIEKIVDAIIASNEKVVADYKGGNVNSLQYLVGQGMKESKGSANPQVLREILEKRLK